MYGVLKVSENANDCNSINVVRLQGAVENGGQLDHKIAFTTSAVDDSLDTDNNEADVNVNHLHLLAAKLPSRKNKMSLTSPGTTGKCLRKQRTT